MATRKLMQEVEKCFKKVAEGVAEFEAIYEKIEQSNNQAQKERLEDNLKREIKKLQRLRDQIKTWASGNDIKDKTPLYEHRKLIETQMERFKAVEKVMKTKAFSKEGLSAAQKLDPKEKAKVETGEFLGNMVDELEQQVEALEAESESLRVTMKKGKNQASKVERIAEIDRIIERHKWHQGKLELIRRSLENGAVQPEQITDIEETIRYYVSDGMNADFIEDEEVYSELNLDEEEDVYGMNIDGDRSGPDGPTVTDDTPEEPAHIPASSSQKSIGKARGASINEGSNRKTSSQLKSPLPTLATLNAPLPTIPATGVALNMKPAPVPHRPAGEGLKYASAAAAGAVSDRAVGLAPLPPPPGSAASASPVPTSSSLSQQSQTTGPSTSTPVPRVATAAVASATNSPALSSSQPVPSASGFPELPKSTAASTKSTPSVASSRLAASSKTTSIPSSTNAALDSPKSSSTVPSGSTASPKPSLQQSTSNVSTSLKSVSTIKEEKTAKSEQQPATSTSQTVEEEDEETEPIYHLPATLLDLVDSYEANKRRPPPPMAPSTLRMLQHSYATLPTLADSDAPRRLNPEACVPSTFGFPQDPLPILDDPRLYARVEPDTLFYLFYYQQGTPQQYMAAKALKDQSWRFHKQYQTWFQRHEEPKSITEEFEQGTYRFFDYESTWMNRRKADFQFAYKFLEDDI